MTELTNVLDGFVRALKNSGEFPDVRFIYAGREAFAEKPVEGFLAACGVKEAKLSKEEGIVRTLATLELCVYAPQNAGARGLSELTQKIAQSLRAADTDKKLRQIKVAHRSFDSNMTVWTQTVTAEFGTLQEAEPVYINGEKSLQILSFQVKRESSYYELRELLQGGTGEYIDLGTKYVVTLTASGEDPFEQMDQGEISVYSESEDRTYANCRVLSSRLKTDGDGFLTREIALECRKSYKGRGDTDE